MEEAKATPDPPAPRATGWVRNPRKTIGARMSIVTQLLPDPVSAPHQPPLALRRAFSFGNPFSADETEIEGLGMPPLAIPKSVTGLQSKLGVKPVRHWHWNEPGRLEQVVDAWSQGDCCCWLAVEEELSEHSSTSMQLETLVKRPSGPHRTELVPLSL